ncbi:MAG: hypothetical protein JNJ98_18435 [Gemmatimonadetes bacterium]|nr:hypothetical protein [Gemmatimonadota bacterium]
MASRALAHLLLSGVLTLCAVGPLDAQLAVDRAVPRTTRDSTDATHGSFWVELLHAPASSSTDVAWAYKLGADIPLVRLPHDLALRLELGHEMVATPANALGFDPRGAVWTEQLTLAGFGDDRWQWMGGLFLRCRHDIDVGTVRDSVAVRGSQRVVVVSGTQLQVQHRPIVRAGLRVDVGSSAEWLTGTGDRRTPASRRTPRWQDARGVWSVSARVSQRGPRGTSVYAQGWQATVMFREPSTAWRTNYRLEAGVQLPGARRRTDLLVATERQFDDMMLPVPRASRALFLGARFGARAGR